MDLDANGFSPEGARAWPMDHQHRCNATHARSADQSGLLQGCRIRQLRRANAATARLSSCHKSSQAISLPIHRSIVLAASPVPINHRVWSEILILLKFRAGAFFGG